MNRPISPATVLRPVVAAALLIDFFLYSTGNPSIAYSALRGWFLIEVFAFLGLMVYSLLVFGQGKRGARPLRVFWLPLSSFQHCFSSAVVGVPKSERPTWKARSWSLFEIRNLSSFKLIQRRDRSLKRLYVVSAIPLANLSFQHSGGSTISSDVLIATNIFWCCPRTGLASRWFLFG